MSVSRRLMKCFALASVFAALSMTALAQNPAATVNVNANGSRHAISPLIYGANWADTAMIADLNLTINRRGGNATTTYNWKTNATNRGGDWYFESLSDGPAIASDSANQFIDSTKAGGAESMITIPLVDWLAKLGPNRSGLTPYSIAKYGPQTAHDPWWADAGNGIATNAANGTTWKITNNTPSDAYVTNSPAYQQEWVQYLTNRYGSSTSGGVKFYLMDNEHAVWPSNHRPIMPVGQTMDQIRDRIFAYGGVVKAVDSNALVVGPEEWGWPNYFTSPYDSQVPGNTDRNNHGGWDYMPWLLNQFKLTNDATGKRLLDIFSLHYYPQYSEFYTSEGDSAVAAQLKRNECTRDLWDPNYLSTSWIANRVKLIPRMKEWVDTYYPGTKTAVTEYSWGAENHISGAIAQADVLGIFGREGLDLATFWGSLNNGYHVRNAFKMYRNYDGNKSTFGDTSVSATVANPDNVSAFAAQRSTNGTLTVMVINKYLTNSTPITVNLAGFTASGPAQVWQFTSANTINHLADTAVSNSSVAFSAPAQSVTLFVIPGTNAPAPEMNALYAFEGNAQDSSGSGNHGTANALSYVTGKVGSQAAQFNGTSSYVSIPRSVQDDFTVTMWVKTTDNSGWAGAQWWNGKGLVDGEVGGGGADWGTALVDGKFVVGIGSTGGDSTFASSVNINDGTWHHLTATRNNTSGAVALYVDGILRGSGTGATGSRTLPPNLRIGSLQTGNNFLNGTLDDVRLYDRILTTNEIASIIGAPPAAPTGVAAIAGNGSVALSWDAATTATNYYVKRSTTSGSGYVNVATNAGLTFTDTGLVNGTPYYYVVSAVNAYGESGNSSQVSATPFAGSAPTSLALVSSANPSIYGSPATFTATITTNAVTATAATGTVTFKDGATVLGAGSVSAGQASLTVSNLNAATHSVTAVYGGDGSFLSSTSSVLSQVVNPLPIVLSGSKVYDGTTNISAASLVIANNLDGTNLTLSGAATLASKNVGARAISDSSTSYQTPSLVNWSSSGYNSWGLYPWFNTPPNFGNAMICVVASRNPSGFANKVSFPDATNFTKIAQSANASGVTTEIWYNPSVYSTNNLLTVNFSNPNTNAVCIVLQYTNLASLGALDQIATATGTGTAAGTGTTPTTTQANELWLGGIGYANTNSLTSILNGFTDVTGQISTGPATNGVDQVALHVLAKVVTATGVASSGGTIGVSQNWAGAMATFKAAGTAAQGLTLGGSAAGNYTLVGVTGTATITAKPLNYTGIAAVNKSYDGTTNASFSGTASLLAAEAPGAGSAADGKPYTGDTVSFVTGVVTGSFADKNIGTGKAVTVTGGLSLSGAQAGNYSVGSPNSALTANITAASLSPVVTLNNRAYDGTTTATTIATRSLSGTIYGGEDVSLTGGTVADFSSAAAGTYPGISITGLSLAGSDAGNYALTSTSTTASASILPAPSSVALASSANPSMQGDDVIFTATLPADASGSVVFTANGSPFSTNALAGGIATASTSVLPVGTNTVTVQFAAQGNYLGSTNSLGQVVTPASFSVSCELVNGQMVLNWPYAGTLLEAPSLNGPWTTNTTGATTANIDPTGGMKFFRVRIP